MEENFDKIKISIATDEDVRSWSHGEVKKPETINYRTLKPEKDGLFCEKIFGPTKDWECHCGKYKKVRYKGIICDRCGVEVTRKSVRRERMGHIELAAPVAHIWFFKGTPNRIALMLNTSPKALERVVYFAAYIVTESNIPTLQVGDILSETEFLKLKSEYTKSDFVAETGAEAIQKLLKRVDLKKEQAIIKRDLEKASLAKKAKLFKRLETVEAFINSGNLPESMIRSTIPVIPPDLRPMVQLDGGRFATSDLNDLYRRVLNRNNRLRRLIDLRAPEIIVKNEKRMLQESVDALFDNSKRSKPITGAGNRPLKSLSEILKGKQGRFRQNLLGKRVDYSGRSVIVVGPSLKIYQCGLPKEMAVELFKPFIMRELRKAGKAQNIKAAKKMVEQQSPEIWRYLEEVIKDHPVLLNRAPTLHRLGIQAFEPVIVEGRAIKLHPLVCSAFNADFDGDQMAVHLPLSPEAQAEARYLMLATNNLIKPADGQPIAVPSQDMILGAYYLTYIKEGLKGEGLTFKDENEAIMAYQNNDVELETKINLRRYDDEGNSKIIETSVGRIIFNKGIPQDLGFVDRNNVEEKFNYEISFPVIKKDLKKIIGRCVEKHENEVVVDMLEFMKESGYKYSTLAGFTIAASDVSVPDEKADIIKEAEKKIDMIVENYKMGLLSETDRYNAVVAIWTEATNKVEKIMMDSFTEDNPINIFLKSGARGDRGTIRQLAGMRGLMADTNGRTIEIPVRSAFAEGEDALEFFISSHGTRKGLVDTALKTATSGYLTRRLVDVSQDIVVNNEDCGTTQGVVVKDIVEEGRLIESFEERIIGRYSVHDVINPNTKEVIVDSNTLIDKRIASDIIEAGIKELEVRSVVACKNRHGVCRKCYGKSLVNKSVVNIGETIGIVAAQAIGEGGTQLTMRTFHAGGVAGGDVTQSLPRVEELFEARNPKGVGILSEIDGEVTVNYDKKTNKIPEIIVTGENEVKKYPATQKILPFITNPEKTPTGRNKKVKVKTGDALTEGSLNPSNVLAIRGVNGVYNYIVTEVQKEYRNQGIDINDKHIEIIIKQMLDKVRVTDPGDSSHFQSALVNKIQIQRENNELEKQGKKPAKYKQVLLGITKASLATESFLSAASFQETTRVLTDAAIKGKTDELVGVKENVIIGKLIPAGTGLQKYENLTTNTKVQDDAIAKIKAEREKYEAMARKENIKNLASKAGISYTEEGREVVKVVTEENKEERQDDEKQ